MMDYLDEPSTILTLENTDSVVLPRGYAHAHSYGRQSPPPRSLPPMSPLPSNRSWVSSGRSASRRGLEDTPLNSPMPMFPRRRSVTFVDEEGERTAREERPYYHTTTADSAMKSAPRPLRYENDENAVPSQGKDSPMVKSILLSRSQYESDSRAGQSNAVTPRKQSVRRSNSRPRLDARRQQAQFDLSFYDDSIVEDFIQKAEKPAAAVVEEPAAAAVNKAAANPVDQLGEAVAAVVGDEKRAKIARLLQEFRAMDNETPNRPSRRAPSVPIANEEDSIAAMELSRMEQNAKSNNNTSAQPTTRKAPSRRSTRSAMILSSDEEEGSARALPRAAKKATAASKSKKDRIRKLIEEAMSQQRGRSKRSFVVIDLPSSPSAERSNDDGAFSDASSDRHAPAVAIQRRSVTQRRSAVRQDSRPNLDDDESDAAAQLSSPGRPLLRRSGVKRTRSVPAAPREPSVAMPKTMLPRAPVAARKPARSRAKKAATVPSMMAAPSLPAPAPQSILTLNSTLNRFATQRVSEAPLPPPQMEATTMWGVRQTAAPAVAQRSTAHRAVKPMDPNDPFSHFFETEFDTPGKFDIPSGGDVGRGPRARGGAKTGLMLATSCRSRR